MIRGWFKKRETKGPKVALKAPGIDEPMELVLATNNLNKLKEVQAMVPQHIKLLSLKDIGCEEDIPETQPTIEGNALQKARYIQEHYGRDCFADDTGLEVTALDGRPGVYSARYAGPERDDRENMFKVLHELENEADRSARFKTVIALIVDGHEKSFEGLTNGHITEKPSGDGGFGYDPIFVFNGDTRTFAEISQDEKNAISHRARATEKLVQFLNKFY